MSLPAGQNMATPTAQSRSPILRERGEEIMESGYMDRRLHVSPDTSDNEDVEGSDSDASSHHDGETLAGM